MKVQTQDLINDLVARTRQVLEDAQDLKNIPPAYLDKRPSASGWSALEAIHHLNLYGNYYLPEIEKAILSGGSKPEEVFRSGLLGNYFAKMMLPGEKMRKMKTQKNKDPLGMQLDPELIDRFILQQKKMLDLLKRSSAVSLNRIKIPLSIGRFVKLRLGDIFRVVIYHNQRHMLQAKNAVK